LQAVSQARLARESEAFYEALNRLDFVVQHCRREAGVGAEEEGGVHDLVGAGVFAKRGANRIRAVLFELHEDGLLEEVAAEEHAVADFLFVQVPAERGVVERRTGTHAEHEAEPATIGPALGGVPGKF